MHASFLSHSMTLHNTSVDFQRVCSEHGLDPNKTSLHAAGCVEHGLDPRTTSIHALECVMLGLDPKTTSIAALHKQLGRRNS